MDVEHPDAGHPPDGPGEHGRRDENGSCEALPCAALLDDVEQYRMPPAGHEHCPHCADAISTLRTLEALIRAELEREVPEQGATLALTERIMHTVQTELRPGPLVPMGEPAEELWITHTAAARAVRRMVDALPGIRAGGCRITAAFQSSGSYSSPGTSSISSLDSSPGPNAGSEADSRSGSQAGPWSVLPARPGRLPRGPVEVRLEIAISPDHNVAETASLVRRTVADRAAEQLGLSVREIEIAVVDLLVSETGPDAGGGRRVR